MPVTDDDGLRELLSMDPVAVVGCSSTSGKAAHDIPKYLQEHGYEVIPVNPYADEILGREAYDSLADVEEEIALVDVFRPSDEVAGIVDDVLTRREDRGDVEGLWLQLGITDDEALARADDAGLLTTQDRCMKVEHGRLVA
ncbi:CoA-binding protein [Halobaculum roseum]|uniref:CoA-binding protein n=1 Tax=Halobaculum roseum TaxID=2175149 RepID=A0ABD5MPP3_9EURY|nr:CoA-binding protein [Halobaculum roseum]QZY03476.1 CoA-binding protein [Halobaculum roseum]